MLGHYACAPDRVIVDRYERGVRVVNVDVLDFDFGTFDWIVSISTLEHVRWDEEPRIECGAVHAVERLRSMLNDDGRLLITVPTGCHPTLDSWLSVRAESPVDSARIETMVRSRGGWVQTSTPEVREYGPRWANAVWIAEFGR